jgi:hypothetical protein
LTIEKTCIVDYRKIDMKIKKITSKKLKSNIIILPLKLYESIMQEVNDYQELQQREKVRWVKVRVNAATKKTVKAGKKA